MIRLFVTDLDGTLLDHGKKVSPREREALQRMKDAGLELCIASGRMHSEMVQVMDEIGFAAYSVSQNGAFMHDKNGELLHMQRFPAELAYELYQIARGYELVKLICSGDMNCLTERSAASDAIQARMFKPFVVRPDAAEALRHDLPACKFSFFGPMELLGHLRQAYEAHFGDRITMYYADHDCLDVMPLGVSKGDALRQLIDRLGLTPHEIACIGDSFNDVSMLELTPHSFAMTWAHMDVKKAAAREEESVAAALAHVHELNRAAASPEGRG